MPTPRDQKIVRELAREYMALVCTEKQQKMQARFRDTNDLKIVRPPLLLDEIPWGQMDIDGELICQCEEKLAREAETYFRRAVFYMKHFKADNHYQPFFPVQRTVDSSGEGLEKKAINVKQSDSTTRIVSSEFEDVLEDESALELLHAPTLTLRDDVDAERMAYFTDLLGDTIPVKLYGFAYFYYTPWDKITFLRGVEPIMMDMYDRPEYLHKIMEKFTAIAHARLDFVEENLDVDVTCKSLHCTPSAVSGLAESGLKATWCRSMAQSFGMVSPAMFKEFEVDYLHSIAERFAYTYYGCCEPLDDKIEVLKSIKNLRKIGCSPWANVEKCAEQIGGNYVLSRKPNPANVAIETDPEVIRREIEQTAKICLKYGCPCDIVLKDISTVSGRPQNLILWTEVASEVLDQYYGG